MALIDQMVAEVGKPKFEYPHADFNQELFDKIVADFMDEAKAAMDTDDKNVREARWNAMIEKWHEKYLEEYPDMDQYLEEFTYKFQKKIVKAWLLEGHRVDGRQKNEIRPLAAEVGLLPRAHGSGLFTRGQTQVLSVCTLDTLSANQKLDTIWEETEKRYMHHYNFPGYSVGEAKPARSPGRREIGHGALAERALVPVLPSVEEFPYAIRVVSEVLSSNGSTSQGSICGSTLALMDAGVPIKAPVAGISCGLIQDDDGSFTTFIDIQGVEDFHGEMDFKVGGTKKGITAIQMDLKNDGLTMEIIKEALDITYDARCEILDQIMLPCIAEPRKEVSKYAPKMLTMHIDPSKIREVIGSGGKVIQKIVADTGAKIDINDDGSIFIAGVDAASCDAAKKCIDDIVFVPEIGKLYYGRVVRLMTFGAFVELAPGKDGLVHISKLADHRIEKVEDACKVGDMMWVKVTDIDEKGRVNLSHKDAMKEIRAKEAAGERVEVKSISPLSTESVRAHRARTLLTKGGCLWQPPFSLPAVRRFLSRGSLRLRGPVQERDDLAPGTGELRGEGGLRGAAGDAVLHRPQDRLVSVPVEGLSVFVSVSEGDVGKGEGALHLRTAGGAPQEEDRVQPGTRRMGLKGPEPPHIPLRGPLDGLVIVGAGICHIHELLFRQRGFRLTGRPPQERGQLGPGTGSVRGEGGRCGAVGDAGFRRPQDGVIAGRGLLHIGEGAAAAAGRDSPRHRASDRQRDKTRFLIRDPPFPNPGEHAGGAVGLENRGGGRYNGFQRQPAQAVDSLILPRQPLKRKAGPHDGGCAGLFGKRSEGPSRQGRRRARPWRISSWKRS